MAPGPAFGVGNTPLREDYRTMHRHSGAKLDGTIRTDAPFNGTNLTGTILDHPPATTVGGSRGLY